MIRRAAGAIALLVLGTSPAFAHSAARGFVLLLPTAHVIVAGALAVLVSFAVVSLLLDRLFRRTPDADYGFVHGSRRAIRTLSFISANVLVLLIWIGLAGPHDPLENMLVLGIWTLWWVVIVLLHPLLGNLWGGLNPFAWIAPAAGRCVLPRWLHYNPALLIFAAFAWFQLVYPAPEDPPRLALVVSAYAALTLAATFVFGIDWLRYADPFAIFLRQLGAATPLGFTKLRLPGAGLLYLAPLPLAGVLFVLMTLASISFDGLSHTFFWLSALGHNPLEYPGRTALIGANTAGLLGVFLLLASAFTATVVLGWLWAGRPQQLQFWFGRYVYSLIPISIAYHFAHYLSDALLNMQYLVLALNDPFGTGAQLLGIESFHVTASFQNTASGAMALYSAQTTAIVAGHVIGVSVAHAMAMELGLPRGRALRLDAPLALFMVFYTGFGLWLLATPTAN